MTARRRELLSGLHGRVVELGAGAGTNFPLYPETVAEVVAVEPEPYLRTRAQAAAARADVRVRVTVVDGIADALPLEDRSCDAAVACLVLCSVPDQARALAELRRVLKDDGQLVYFEHVLAHGRLTSALQRVVDRTFWPHAFGGCHTARDTPAAIAAAGFRDRRAAADTRRRPQGAAAGRRAGDRAGDARPGAVAVAPAAAARRARRRRGGSRRRARRRCGRRRRRRRRRPGPPAAAAPGLRRSPRRGARRGRRCRARASCSSGSGGRRSRRSPRARPRAAGRPARRGRRGRRADRQRRRVAGARRAAARPVCGSTIASASVVIASGPSWNISRFIRVSTSSRRGALGGVGAQGGAQLRHHDRRADAVADDVADRDRDAARTAARRRRTSRRRAPRRSSRAGSGWPARRRAATCRPGSSWRWSATASRRPSVKRSVLDRARGAVGGDLQQVGARPRRSGAARASRRAARRARGPRPAAARRAASGCPSRAGSG